MNKNSLNWLRTILFLPTYLAYMLLLDAPTLILGWFIIPPLALLNKWTTKTETSKINGRQILNWKSRLFYVWSNDEDGLDGALEYRNKPLWFRIIYWSAVRNPNSNMRFIKNVSVSINPKQVRFIATDVKMIDNRKVAVSGLSIYDEDRFRFTTLTWQGIYSNLRIQFKMFGSIWRFWIGWKLLPQDTNGVDKNDYRAHGAGYALQFKRIYPPKA